MGSNRSADDRSAAGESHLQVSHEGRVAATATVTGAPDPHGTARVSLHSRREVVAPHARSELVDKVLDQPGVRAGDHVHVVLPVGDTESIGRLQERTTNFHARAAGSSSVIDADVARPVTGI